MAQPDPKKQNEERGVIESAIETAVEFGSGLFSRAARDLQKGPTRNVQEGERERDD